MLHDLLVLSQGLSPLAGEADHRTWLPGHESLFYLDVAGLFQLAQVRGEVSPGQPRRTHEKDEVRAFGGVQVHQDRQTRRLVDDLCVNR